MSATVVSVLPATSADNRGALYLLQGAVNAPDGLYVCEMLADGTYDFVQLRQ